MGLGSTAKKLQKVSDVAEKMYKRMNEMREQLQSLRGTVEDTGEQVDSMEVELQEQRAILEAIAEEQDIDVDSVIADAVIEDATESSDGGSEETADADA